MMNGITEDHQFKTRSGWKYFHEIELDKDELYCWEMTPKTGGFLNKSYIENTTTFKNTCRGFLKPVKKEFHLSYTNELYYIKNKYIDSIMTPNHKCPAALLETDNYKDQYVELQPAREIYENVNKCWEIATEDDDSEYDDYQSMFGVTEYFTKSPILFNLENKWNSLFYKLMPADFKVIIKDSSIVSFTMSETPSINENMLIYARRNGTEFWI